MGYRSAPKEHPATETWKEIHALYEQGNFPVALQRMQALAATGDPSAPVEIAHLYEIGGNGLTVDLAKAREWYERAASNHSDSHAYVALGRIYFAGFGVPQDYRKAFEYFLKSDLESEPGALYALGLMSALGHGTEQSQQVALSYFERAARKGHLVALKNLGVMQFEEGRMLKGIANYTRAVAKIILTAVTNPDSSTLRIQ